MIYFINENILITHVLTISLRVLLIYAVRKKSTAYLLLVSQLTFPFFFNDYNRLRDFYANKNCLNKFFKFNILDDLYIH